MLSVCSAGKFHKKSFRTSCDKWSSARENFSIPGAVVLFAVFAVFVVLGVLTVVVNFGVGSVVDSVREAETAFGNCTVVDSGRRLVVVNFSVELLAVVSMMLVGVVTTSLIDESILSALASIISSPALMRSKKLFSVDGSALNGCSVVTSTAFSFAVLASSGGSSDPKSSEKKSMESFSSSGSSSSTCCTWRGTFRERLQS